MLPLVIDPAINTVDAIGCHPNSPPPNRTGNTTTLKFAPGPSENRWGICCLVKNYMPITFLFHTTFCGKFAFYVAECIRKVAVRWYPVVSSGVK